MKILANDGIDASAKAALEAAGYTVIDEKYPQESLAKVINDSEVVALIVRSATTARKELIDVCPSLKVIARAGVGIDNIDAEYAREKGIEVINTPGASSNSVAELVIAHIMTGIRHLHDSNRHMAVSGSVNFTELKKKYSKGTEAAGKTIGIIGFGRIGQAVAKMAIGLGMKPIAYDPMVESANVTMEIFDGQRLTVNIETQSMEEVLRSSDFVTIHVPGGTPIGKTEIDLMKDGAGLINTSRGNAADEQVILDALESGKLSFVALDVFKGEPSPRRDILENAKISLTPHIGAATEEAQKRIGQELSEKLISSLRRHDFSV
jgi:D-3-phosphoglycerate dehydrogenase